MTETVNAPASADALADAHARPSKVGGDSAPLNAEPGFALALRTTPALLWVGFVAATLALLVGISLWQRLDRIQQELARQSAASAEDARGARAAAEQTQNLTQTLQARLAVVEVKLAEVSLQRSQMEELMLSVSRSRDDTLVQDIESGLRLASQQADLTGSVQPLVAALVAVDRRIGKAAQPRLNPVQRAVARDIERIRSASVMDVPALTLRLDELLQQADDLRLVNAPPRDRAGRGSPTGKVRGATARANASENEGVLTNTDASPLEVGSGSSVGWGQEASSVWRELWTQAARSSIQLFGDLVRVGRIDRPEAVLLAPDQAYFLRENLKLKLLNARLGLMSRQVGVIRTDLGSVRHMLVTYFDPQDVSTRQAIQLVAEIMLASKSADVPRPDETMTALAAAAAGR